MKSRAILLIILILVSQISMAGDWKIIPHDYHENFTDLFFLNENQGFLVTQSGMIISISADSSGWHFQTRKSDILINGVFFTENGKKGFAVGSGGVLMRSNDSGLTWNRDTLNNKTWLNDIAFTDDKTGLVVGIYNSQDKGNQGISLFSTDGGETWVNLEQKGMRFTNIETTRDKRIFFTESNHIFVSNDNGSTWSKVRIPSRSTPLGISFYGEYGIAVGMGGLLIVSDDGGMKWENLQVIPKSMALMDVLLIGSKKAYAVGGKGEILYTDDGGYNWIPEASGTYNDLIRIGKIGNRLIACGDRGALLYKDLDN